MPASPHTRFPFPSSSSSLDEVGYGALLDKYIPIRSQIPVGKKGTIACELTRAQIPLPRFPLAATTATAFTAPHTTDASTYTTADSLMIEPC